MIDNGFSVRMTTMNNNQNSAKQIISRFGGQSALASLLSKRQSTVQHWAKTGRIPSHWHARLLELARKQGIALEPRDFVSASTPTIEPPEGRLGVLLVGLGAVSSTFIAGVEHIRRGSGQPIGSVSQMATIRLGKRSDRRSPFIKDFVPLADLDQLVFGAWDPFPDDAYEAAIKSGVLDRHEEIEPIGNFLKTVEPMEAVFDSDYVARIQGINVKLFDDKLEAVEAIREDIRRFKTENECDRLVMAWCASTEIFIRESEVHQDIESFMGGLRGKRQENRTLNALCLCRPSGRSPIHQRGTEPVGGCSRSREAGPGRRRSGLRKGLQDRPNTGQDGYRADAQGEDAGR